MATLTLTRLRELIRMRKMRDSGAEEVLLQLLVDHRDELQAVLGRELVPEANDPGALAVLEVRLNRAVRDRHARAHRCERRSAETLARRVCRGARAVPSGYELPLGSLTELVGLGGFQDLVFQHAGHGAAVSRRVLHAILRELRGVEIDHVCISDALHIAYRTCSSRGRFALKLHAGPVYREHVVVDLDAIAPGAPSTTKEPVDRVRPTLTPAADRRSA